MSKFEQILAGDALIINKKVNLKELAGKSIIITGASGLIGINFLASLKEFSKKIKDKNKLPKITAVFGSNTPEYLKGLLNFPNLNIKKGDVTDNSFIASLPKADYIVHAAGFGQPGKFMQDRIKTIAINTSATMGLLNKLNEGGKFLFISTSEVYSGLEKPPFKESEIGTTNTTHPRSCYIEGKRCGEAICNTYFEKGVQVKSARLSLAYGPGTKPGDMRALNSFIEKALSQGKIEMMDRGEAKRTYCYVRDAVEIMWHILLEGKEPIYNVGGFSSTTIGGLAKSISKIVGVKVLMPKESKKLVGAPDDVRLDMTKSAKEFKKTKKDFVSLEEGLKKTIEWQKALYGK